MTSTTPVASSTTTQLPQVTSLTATSTPRVTTTPPPITLPPVLVLNQTITLFNDSVLPPGIVVILTEDLANKLRSQNVSLIELEGCLRLTANFSLQINWDLPTNDSLLLQIIRSKSNCLSGDFNVTVVPQYQNVTTLSPTCRDKLEIVEEKQDSTQLAVLIQRSTRCSKKDSKRVWVPVVAVGAVVVVGAAVAIVMFIFRPQICFGVTDAV